MPSLVANCFAPSNRARFFNDVFSKGGFGGIWHTLRAFYDGDAYLALPLGSQLVDQMVSFGWKRLTWYGVYRCMLANISLSLFLYLGASHICLWRRNLGLYDVQVDKDGKVVSRFH
jgi:hypothetical protein